MSRFREKLEKIRDKADAIRDEADAIWFSPYDYIRGGLMEEWIEESGDAKRGVSVRIYHRVTMIEGKPYRVTQTFKDGNIISREVEEE